MRMPTPSDVRVRDTPPTNPNARRIPFGITTDLPSQWLWQCHQIYHAEVFDQLQAQCGRWAGRRQLRSATTSLKTHRSAVLCWFSGAE